MVILRKNIRGSTTIHPWLLLMLFVNAARVTIAFLSLKCISSKFSFTILAIPEELIPLPTWKLRSSPPIIPLLMDIMIVTVGKMIVARKTTE